MGRPILVCAINESAYVLNAPNRNWDHRRAHSLQALLAENIFFQKNHIPKICLQIQNLFWKCLNFKNWSKFSTIFWIHEHFSYSWTFFGFENILILKHFLNSQNCFHMQEHFWISAWTFLNSWSFYSRTIYEFTNIF